MDFDLKQFCEAPTREQLFKCTKARLMSIAEHYRIETASVSLKVGELQSRIVTVLVEQGVLQSESEDSALSQSVQGSENKTGDEVSPPQDAQSLRLYELELQLKLKKKN